MQKILNKIELKNPTVDAIPETSDEAKQKTMHRSAAELEPDGKIRVTCYDCKKNILWTSYERHLETTVHKENAKTRSNLKSEGNGLKKKRRVIRGRGKPMDINKLRSAIKAIVN
jgi:hypothetical protein